MKIRNAWNIKQMPDHYIAELDNGALETFRVTPFREIKESDLTEYKGGHPRKMRGVPMPEYLYRFYGLERVESVMTEVVRIRMTPDQADKFRAVGGSETVRKLIDGM